eukprot:scaffold1087_cov198-Pinguiococcus_pyrenoidosus.AAC.25
MGLTESGPVPDRFPGTSCGPCPPMPLEAAHSLAEQGAGKLRREAPGTGRGPGGQRAASQAFLAGLPSSFPRTFIGPGARGFGFALEMQWKKGLSAILNLIETEGETEGARAPSQLQELRRGGNPMLWPGSANLS